MSALSFLTNLSTLTELRNGASAHATLRALGIYPLPGPVTPKHAVSHAILAKAALDSARAALIILPSFDDAVGRVMANKAARDWMAHAREHWDQVKLALVRGTAHVQAKGSARVHEDGDELDPQWVPQVVIHSDYRRVDGVHIVPCSSYRMLSRESKRFKHRRSAERFAKRMIERLEHGQR